jgi:hypothetical protein
VLDVSRLVHFTREDCLHAALGVIPAFFLIAFGHIAFGVGFAIGLLPTSLMGISPHRKMRLVYGVVGCLFGVGIYIGAQIVTTHNVYEAALLLFAIAFVATVLASLKPAGALLLGILVPSLGVGTGYSVAEAKHLVLAFVAGSLWSCLVMLPWPEFPQTKDVRALLLAMQPNHVKTYGVLLGLTAATSILIGHLFDLPYAGWIATAAMLVIRPFSQMTGFRGVGRAVSTIVGTILVIITLHLSLGDVGTAIVCAVIAVLTIGARTSKLYVTPFGTAFLILTIELHGITDTHSLNQIGRYRIGNNVIGAAIALFYGLFISWALKRIWFERRTPAPASPPPVETLATPGPPPQ